MEATAKFTNIHKLSTFSRLLGPESRILYFPQKLIAPLWEMVFKQMLSTEIAHHSGYLWQLNSAFQKLGVEKSHQLLDEVERDHKDTMLAHYQNLEQFMQVIKKEFLAEEKKVFDLSISKSDDIESLKQKIQTSHTKIWHAIKMNWIAFSDMQISNLEEDLLDMQISDMTYIALDHIQRDQDFLEELLKTSDVKLSAPLQKTIESISDSLEEIMFAHAKTSDIPGINSCMEENLFDNLTDHKQGRLYYPVDEDEFKTYVGNQKNIFLCAKEENRVLGYILSYDVKQRMNKKETRFDDLQIPQGYKEKIQTEPVLYARHVAIDPKSQNQGIGKKLEKQTLQEAQQRGYKHVMGEIMTSPMRNITSLEVHQKAGFQTIGKISYPDGTCWDVVWKDL